MFVVLSLLGAFAVGGIALAGVVLSLFVAYMGYRTGSDAREDARSLAREVQDHALRLSQEGWQNARTLASEEREHQAAEARKARLSEYRRQVYPDVLEYVLLIMDTVQRTEPAFTFEGAPKPPPWPEEREVRKITALTYAAVSPALGEALQELSTRVLAFQRALGERAAEVPGAPGPKALELANRIEETRRGVDEHGAKILNLANRELGERKEPPQSAPQRD